MSLFPAYSSSNAATSSDTTKQQSSLDWLSFKSYDEKQANDSAKAEHIHETETSATQPSVSTATNLSKPVSNASSNTTTAHTSSRKPSKPKLLDITERAKTSTNDQFRVDTKSDRNNLCFDSLYFKNVANYDKHKTIDISKKRSKTTTNKTKRLKWRYFTDENKKIAKNQESLGIPVKDVKTRDNNFIPLSQTIALTNSETNETKIKFNSMSTDSDAKIYGPLMKPSHEQMVYEKTEQFNRYLRENEHDIQKWLSYIAFQTESINRESDEKFSEDTVWHKKLSICEKALEYNPNCTELLLNRLEIANNLWEFEKLRDEWKKLTFLYPNSIEVWQRYIKFSQSNVAHFSASKTANIYRKCLTVLCRICEQTFGSLSPPPQDLDIQIVNIFTSYCDFTMNIGNTEKAVATYQALIEFNLFAPTLLSFEMSIKEWITLFEPFWDSNAQRFGEEGAIGWCNVMKTKHVDSERSDCDNSIVEAEESKIISEKFTKNIIWLKFELLRHSYHWLSPRSEDVDDIERFILSDDIIPWLFRLNTIESKYYLVIRFLESLGVNIENSFTSKYNLANKSDIEIDSFHIDLPLMPCFCNQHKFIDNIFNVASNLFTGKFKLDLILVWINYQKQRISDSSDFSARQMRKFLKNFLSNDEFRNCLPIWTEFAAFEWSIASNVSEARKVFQTAISMMLKVTESFEMNKFARKYVCLELGITSLHEMSIKITDKISSDNDELALNAILTVTCGQLVTKCSPTVILKAINNIKSLSTSDEIFCLVYLHYLTKGITQSIDLLEQQLSQKTDLQCEEQLFQLYLELHLLHIRRNSGESLSSLRSVLNRALYLNANNKHFLSVLVNLESNSNIYYRMSRFFSKNINLLHSDKYSDQCWHLVIHAIHSEFRKLAKINEQLLHCGYDTNGGVINRVRAIFEKSLSSYQLSNNVTLWRLYCKFEMKFNTEMHAKSVFYRALQRCPSYKILYLDGIQYFSSQLRELVDVMTEKELRVRTPIEEIDLLFSNH